MGVKITTSCYSHPGTSLAFTTGSWRQQRPVHVHRVAPCHGVCPAGEDAQAYLSLVEEERFRENLGNDRGGQSVSGGHGACLPPSLRAGV